MCSIISAALAEASALAEFSARIPSVADVVLDQSDTSLNQLLSAHYVADDSSPIVKLQSVPLGVDYGFNDDDNDDALLSLLADDVAPLWQ